MTLRLCLRDWYHGPWTLYHRVCGPALWLWYSGPLVSGVCVIVHQNKGDGPFNVPFIMQVNLTVFMSAILLKNIWFFWTLHSPRAASRLSGSLIWCTTHPIFNLFLSVQKKFELTRKQQDRGFFPAYYIVVDSPENMWSLHKKVNLQLGRVQWCCTTLLHHFSPSLTNSKILYKEGY